MTGQAQAPGQAAREFTAYAEAQGILRGEMYGWATMSDVFAAGMQAALAAQERPATALAADPTADDLAIAALTDQLAVTAAERDDLRRALDERNAQHKALLDYFVLTGHGHAAFVMEDTELARAYRDAGYPVRDDLSHLEKP